MKILEKYNKLELILLLENSKSFRDFLRKIKSSSNGSGSYRSIKTQLNRMEIEIPKYDYIIGRNSLTRLNNDEVFIENSTYNRQHLKSRIINECLIKYVCDKCGNDGSWQGQILSLQLEHKNGINNDNRLQNLCFLCPNCHSQTDTYSGKSLKKEIKTKIRHKKEKTKKEIKTKKGICECGKEIMNYSKRCIECNNKYQRRVERPSYKNIMIDVKKYGYRKTGEKYGVSDNAVRKWIISEEKILSNHVLKIVEREKLGDDISEYEKKFSHSEDWKDLNQEVMSLLSQGQIPFNRENWNLYKNVIINVYQKDNKQISDIIYDNVLVTRDYKINKILK